MATRFFLRQLARLLRYHNRVKLPVLKAFREHPEALILRIDAATPFSAALRILPRTLSSIPSLPSGLETTIFSCGWSGPGGRADRKIGEESPDSTGQGGG